MNARIPESSVQEEKKPLFPPLQRILEEDPEHEALLRTTIASMQRLVREDESAAEEIENLFNDPETERILMQVDEKGKSLMTRIRSAVDHEKNQLRVTGKGASA